MRGGPRGAGLSPREPSERQFATVPLGYCIRIRRRCRPSIAAPIHHACAAVVCQLLSVRRLPLPQTGATLACGATSTLLTCKPERRGTLAGEKVKLKKKPAAVLRERRTADGHVQLQKDETGSSAKKPQTSTMPCSCVRFNLLTGRFDFVILVCFHLFSFCTLTSQPTYS